MSNTERKIELLNQNLANRVPKQSIRSRILQVVILVAIANAILFLPQMVNYPYSEIPYFYAHLGRSVSIIQNDSIQIQYPTSYLNFPNLFVLLVQISLSTDGGLLLSGALLPFILVTLYALIAYQIIMVLSEDSQIAFVGALVSIVTNAAINVVFVSPGYLNWMLVLVAEYLTWKFLLSVNEPSSNL